MLRGAIQPSAILPCSLNSPRQVSLSTLARGELQELWKDQIFRSWRPSHRYRPV